MKVITEKCKVQEPHIERARHRRGLRLSYSRFSGALHPEFLCVRFFADVHPGTVIGSMFGTACYADTVTIPVVLSRAQLHGVWLKARVQENPLQRVRIRRKGKQYQASTENVFDVDVLGRMSPVLLSSTTQVYALWSCWLFFHR